MTGGDWVWPSNSWVRVDAGGPPPGLVGEGYADGEVPPDLRLTDQFGDEVSLWQFYGDLIVFDVSTIWCGPCRALGEHTQETVDAFGSDGLTYLTVLQEDLEGNPPNGDDLNLWADTYGIAAPILEDSADPAQTAAALLAPGTFPALLLIDRQMRVLKRVNPSDDATLTSEIESAI